MNFHRKAILPVFAAMCLAGALYSTQFTARAEELHRLAASPICASARTDEAELRQRRSAIETKLADKRRELERMTADAGKPAGAQPARKLLLGEIEVMEGDLVDVIYLLDCHRTDWEPQKPAASGGAGGSGVSHGQGGAGAPRTGGPRIYARRYHSAPNPPSPPSRDEAVVESAPSPPGDRGGSGGSGGSGGTAIGTPGRGGSGGSDAPVAGSAPRSSPGETARGLEAPAPGAGTAPGENAKASSEKQGAGNFVEITSYYATNRKPTGSIVPAEFYGTDDAQMQYGRMVVTIPAAHTPGNIELPSLWKFEINADPSKHFVIKELAPLESAAALGELRRAVGKAGSRSVLLFVHGFNVTFAEAGLRTAQLAHDLAFQGVPMFMSWPASRLYTHDVEAVEVAEGSMHKLLDDIAKLPFDNVYILAHSMGTRLVAKVLADRQQRGADLSKIRDLMLAAPDINAQIFETQIAPALSRMTKARKTIYASSNDLALRASMAIQGYRRVGETSGGVLTFPGFDTIDCSNIAPLQRSWGHSYLFDSNLVLADLVAMLIGGKAAAERKLMRTGIAPALYWLLQSAP